MCLHFGLAKYSLCAKVGTCEYRALCVSDVSGTAVDFCFLFLRMKNNAITAIITRIPPIIGPTITAILVLLFSTNVVCGCIVAVVEPVKLEFVDDPDLVLLAVLEDAVVVDELLTNMA